LAFAPIRPDMPGKEQMAKLALDMMDRKNGTRALVEKFVMVHLKDSWEDTRLASRGMDAMVGGALCLGVPMASERLGIPWASAVLQPMGYVSALDSPTIAGQEWMEATRGWGALGEAVRRGSFGMGRLMARGWCVEHARLRRELGLSESKDPIMDAGRSKWLSLAMFPDYFGAKQADWPESSVSCGFPYAAPAASSESMPERLERFLAAGAKPLCFTLGTAAVHAAGSFYRQSRAAAEKLGMRAVFLTGPEGINAMGRLPETMIAVEYAPHSELFPRCAASIHSCGIGTCAAAIGAGAPQLAVPWANDQPDNARRLMAMGLARVLGREKYTAEAAVLELMALRSDPAYASAAKRWAATEAGRRNGADVAAYALLAKLG
jgi:UDP:flavonoid glycosyltransferase YjiC (YdhE family)